MGSPNVQQAGSVFTVQWLASFMRGASAQPPRGALTGLEGRRGAEARAWASSWHHRPGRASPEARPGLPSPPGGQQRALLSRDPSGLKVKNKRPRGHLTGLYFTGKAASAIPPCFSLQRQVPARWCSDSLAPGRSSECKGFFVPWCPSCSPTVHGPPGPKSWGGSGRFRGTERSSREAKEQKVLGLTCQPPSST